MVSLPSSPLATLRGRFTEAHATRLSWRAGFGPKPGEVAKLAALGLEGAVASLSRPSGPARLFGPRPHGEHGRPLDPYDVWGDDHCWWLDRMVRSDQPLQERMTLIWHSWFATSIDGGPSQRMMLRQNAMMRSRWLGNFHDLLVNVTKDPAMLIWLNGTSNNKWSVNENYGREMMELFTLGQGRGYGQSDVVANARALTGWANQWSDARGDYDFHFDPDLHDDGVKSLLGQKGRFDWQDSCRLCVEHWAHPSFMVEKLWGFFVAEPIPAADLKTLAHVYTATGYEVRPLVEAILRHPLFYTGERMVLPPVVFCAGLLRAQTQGVSTDAWAWIGQETGQKLFEPPNVAGWDYTRWLDTARWAGRLDAVNYALEKTVLNASTDKHYPAAETAEAAVQTALRFWGSPVVAGETEAQLLGLSRRIGGRITSDWEQVPYRVMRQNALRVSVAMSPDWQTC